MAIDEPVLPETDMPPEPTLLSRIADAVGDDEPRVIDLVALEAELDALRQTGEDPPYEPRHLRRRGLGRLIGRVR